VIYIRRERGNHSVGTGYHRVKAKQFEPKRDKMSDKPIIFL